MPFTCSFCAITEKEQLEIIKRLVFFDISSGKIYTFQNFILCILTAFVIANNATPTSANTASHMVAIP